jgi:hypothetical protein
LGPSISNSSLGPWYIELEPENPWILDDDFVKLHINKLSWIEIECKIFLSAMKPASVAKIVPEEQNPREDQTPWVSIPNTDDSQTQEPSLIKERGTQPATTPLTK